VLDNAIQKEIEIEPEWGNGKEIEIEMALELGKGKEVDRVQ
jgi:hypothetical protein